MNRFKLIILLVTGLWVLAGCNTSGISVQGSYNTPAERTTYYKHKHPGPPPHAPAHGYRAKYHGHSMVYDRDVDAYVVVNLPDTYFGNNLYLRFSSDGRWMASASLGGNWRLAVGHEIPYKLKTRYWHKHKKHKKKKWYYQDQNEQ